jgi:hypothetical protein
MDPEDDLASWILVTTTMTEDLAQFSTRLPALERLIDSIIETGQLPGSIATFTNYFLVKLTTDIAMGILRLSQIADRQVLEEFIRLLIKIGNYGIQTGNPRALSSLRSLLLDSTAKVYSVLPDCTLSYVINLCVENGILASCLETLEKGVKDANILTYVHHIGEPLSRGLGDSDFWTYADAIGNATLALVESDIRAPTPAIIALFDSVFNSAKLRLITPDSFCAPWLQLRILRQQSFSSSTNL